MISQTMEAAGIADAPTTQDESAPSSSADSNQRPESPVIIGHGPGKITGETRSVPQRSEGRGKGKGKGKAKDKGKSKQDDQRQGRSWSYNRDNYYDRGYQYGGQWKRK